MNIKPDHMMKVAAEACDLLKAVANPHRLVMLCQLVDSEKSVGQLAASLNIRDSAASQNLSLMRKQGIVAARRDGQIMWYSIASAEIRAILEVLYGIYCVERPLCESVPSSRKPRKTSNKRKSR